MLLVLFAHSIQYRDDQHMWECLFGYLLGAFVCLFFGINGVASLVAAPLAAARNEPRVSGALRMQKEPLC